MTEQDSDSPWYRDPWRLLALALLFTTAAMASKAFGSWGWLVELRASEWIAVAGTLASLSAAAVALWLGVGGNSRAEREAVAKSNLVAAGVAVTLQSNLNRFQLLQAGTMFRDLGDPGPDQPLTLFSIDLALPIRVPQLDMLSWLIPLPNHCAGRVARAFGLLEALQEQVNSSTWPREIDAKESLLLHWKALLDEAVDLLTVTELACRKAAALGGPSPTGEELYGDYDPSGDE